MQFLFGDTGNLASCLKIFGENIINVSDAQLGATESTRVIFATLNMRCVLDLQEKNSSPLPFK